MSSIANASLSCVQLFYIKAQMSKRNCSQPWLVMLGDWMLQLASAFINLFATVACDRLCDRHGIQKRSAFCIPNICI